MHSCLYEGIVVHRRYTPQTHSFRYRLCMVMLDIDEVEPRDGGASKLPWLARRKFAIASLLRGDHFGTIGVDDASGQASVSPRPTFRETVESLVESTTGTRPLGPIRMLTQLRYFGYYFSPLNLFYVYNRTGNKVETVVAEVSNTPWKQKHCYVLWDGNRLTETDGKLTKIATENVSKSELVRHREATTNALRFEHAKDFHVSPFLPMDMTYRWSLGQPGETLSVSLVNVQNGENVHAAGMSLQRHNLSRGSLFWAAIRYPFMTIRIIVAIHYQALRLWIKRVPFHSHPDTIDKKVK